MPVHTRLPRILRLLRLVAAGHRTDAAQLAELLGVSRRTVFRDIDVLRRAEVPIFFNEGEGRYGLHADPLATTIRHIPPEEMAMLLVAAHVSPLNRSTGIHDSVEHTIAKLVAGSRALTHVAARNLLACCELSRPAEKAKVSDVDAKTTLLEAVKRGREVRVSLVDRLPEDQWHTKIAPYQILIDHDDWTVIGRSSFDRATCRFRVADIRRAELTDDLFTVPANFRVKDDSSGQ